ncbi:MAG: hypothetical protein AB7T63_11735 [Planctomycetota bacterium]
MEPGGLDAVDPNLVAAAVDGVIGEHERQRLDALVHADPETLLLVRALRDERRRARRRPWLLAGAGGAVAVAAVLAVLLGGRGASPVAQRPLRERLATVVAQLHAEHPDRFATMDPASLLEARRPGTTRGAGTAWLAPRGLTLTPPAVLRWSLPAGSTRMRVEVKGGAVRFQRDVDGAQMDAPSLAAGRYVVTLTPLDGLTRQSVRSAFEVLDDEGRKAWDAEVAAVRAAASDDVADLLVALWAAQRGLVDVARDMGTRAAAAPGEVGDAARRLLETLAQ